MKIISGIYKGRNIKGFDIVGTRPTMSRVRESLMASINGYLPNSVVLDLFSGSGILALEALSNGASKAYFVDNNKLAINAINENINNLKIIDACVYKGDSIRKLNDFIKENIKFNIIFLDPPYNTPLLEESLKLINNNTNILYDNHIIVCETTKNINYDIYNNLTITKEKKYGDKKVIFLKLKK